MMKFAAGVLWCVCVAGTASVAGAQTGPVSEETSAVLAAMPAKDVQSARKAAAEVIKAGQERILEVCSQLVPTGQGNDAAARYLIDSLTWHVSRPGAEKERRLYAKSLAAALEAAPEKEVKVFLMEQLGWIGGDESVEVLAAQLSDSDLTGPAVRALLATRSEKAVPRLVAALPAAEGRNKLSLVLAVGDARAKEAVDELVPLARSEDPELKRAALYALANIGAAEAVPALAEASDTTSPLELGRLASWKLLYARRAAESGNRDQAVAVCREVAAAGEKDDQIQCAVLGTLVEIQKEKAVEDLLKAMDSPSHVIRRAAVNFAQEMAGEKLTRLWVARIKEVSPPAQAEILDMLSRRGDASALPALKQALKAEDQAVRVQAIIAAGRLGGKSALKDLLTVLAGGQKEEIDTVRQVVTQWSGDDVKSALAGALASASDPGRVMLLDVLAVMGAEQHKEKVFAQAENGARSVRVAAFKALNTLAAESDLPRLVNMLLKADSSSERAAAQKAIAAVARRSPEPAKALQPLLQVYPDAAAENKEAVLGAMARIGGNEALEVVTKETSSADAALKTAAIRALSEWSGEEALPQLLALIEGSDELNHHVLATRGFARLLAESGKSDEEKVALCSKALSKAKNAEEKRLLLASLDKLTSEKALNLVAPYLADEELRNEAALTIARVACPDGGKDKGVRGARAAAVLLKAIPYLQDEELKKKSESHVNSVWHEIETSQPPADADGFVPLFNGKDLAGWTGSTDGYTVEDGVLVCTKEKGGNLYTEKQYDDFTLKFEFKLTPGANNGLGIRTPLEGTPAFAGMELQILDDPAEEYKDLKPYQLHGSVYGVVPAKPGHLKPAGEWNEQEVTARGGKLTVKLNGTVIVDTDLDQLGDGPTLDGQPHPGLKRRQGHIAFLGHGHRVDFRNILVKELANEPPAGFTALFNGRDLSGWKGLVEDPKKRAAMTPEELKEAQEKADQKMRDHWKVVNGVLVFDGKGSHLCTARDYKDVEMLVDWKIGPGGDSGIYLRGTPQVQIWDPAHWPEGSGGLYNNQKNTSSPLVMADRPLGEWNTFRIKMIGDKVTVHLNDQLVVDNVPLENFWDREQALFPTGQIELQSHGSPAYFRNVYLRELSGEEAGQSGS